MATEVPRLGPRAWHIYLLLEEPKDMSQLKSATGLADSSVRAHLRRLAREGLVTHDGPAATGVYRRSPDLPPEVTSIAERAAARYASPVGTADVTHAEGDEIQESNGSTGLLSPATPAAHDFERFAVSEHRPLTEQREELAAAESEAPEDQWRAPEPARATWTQQTEEEGGEVGAFVRDHPWPTWAALFAITAVLVWALLRRFITA